MELHKIKGEKGELLVDNQRMAELLSASEGDSQEAGQVMERLNEERRSLQSHCRQLRDNGNINILNYTKFYNSLVGNMKL